MTEALDRSSSSIAASPECAQERRQLCTAIYSCLVRRRREREVVRSFASTAYLLTWSWLLTDCPGTYVRTYVAGKSCSRGSTALHCLVVWRLLPEVALLSWSRSSSLVLCPPLQPSFVRSFSLSLLTSSSRRSQCKSMHAH